MRRRLVAIALAAVFVLPACDNTMEVSPAASEADLQNAVTQIVEACS